MKRWRLGLVVPLALALVAAPLAAEAQHGEKVYRLGYLAMSSGLDGTRLDSLRQGLRELGYLEGRNIVFEIRYAEGKPERLPDLAAELVRAKVDLLVTATGQVAVAAKKATQTIPIVMIGSGDAVKQGLAVSLALLTAALALLDTRGKSAPPEVRRSQLREKTRRWVDLGDPPDKGPFSEVLLVLPRDSGSGIGGRADGINSYQERRP